MIFLKANTAITLRVGPFVDPTDANTVKDALTLAQADIRLSKAGGAFAQTNDAGGATIDEKGWYSLQLNATDTNTEGLLVLNIHQAANAMPVWKEFMVLSQAAYDSLFVAKDLGFLDVNIKTVGRADAQETEANNLESACANYSATRGLAGTALPAVAADGAGGLPISDAGGLDMDAILADTNELQTDDVPGLIAALNDPTAAAIADAVWDETVTGHDGAGKAGAQLWTDLDAVLFDTAVTIPAAISAVSALVTIVDGVVDTILLDTNELQTDDIPGKIDALNDVTAAVVADAVWDEAAADHVGAGSFGAQCGTDIDAILADTGTDGVVLATGEDVYHADVVVTVDETNVKDEYTAVWFKNGVRVTAGITVPKIQVVKRADGTDLVAVTAMSQIGATGAYKYDEPTNRLTAGEAAVALVTATIDAAGREWAVVVSRDSA